MEFGLKHKHHPRVLSHFYDFVAVIIFLLIRLPNQRVNERVNVPRNNRD